MISSLHESPLPPDLPLEFRAAIDVIALICGSAGGEIQGFVLGNERLALELCRYAPLNESHTHLIALGLTSAELADQVDSRPDCDILTLVQGPLFRVINPLAGANAIRGSLHADIQRDQWTRMGYQRVNAIGIQGCGSIGWAVAERLLRRIRRQDLADRCRIGMLRTLIAAKPLALGSIRIHHYQRAAQ